MQQFGSRPESRGPSPDQATLFRIAWFIGLALLLALTAPQPLFAATFSALLGMSSLALALGALLLREPVWADRPTRWDAAAVLYLLGACFGWFVDRAEVREFLRAQGISG